MDSFSLQHQLVTRCCFCGAISKKQAFNKHSNTSNFNDLLLLKVNMSPIIFAWPGNYADRTTNENEGQSALFNSMISNCFYPNLLLAGNASWQQSTSGWLLQVKQMLQFLRFYIVLINTRKCVRVSIISSVTTTSHSLAVAFCIVYEITGNENDPSFTSRAATLGLDFFQVAAPSFNDFLWRQSHLPSFCHRIQPLATVFHE